MVSNNQSSASIINSAQSLLPAAVSSSATINAAVPIASTDKTDKEKIPRRTKSKAGDTAEIPDKVPVITIPKYRDALTLIINGTAYLQPVSDIQNIKYSDGILLFNGLPATSAELSGLYTSRNIKEFNLPLLRALYGVIHHKIYDTPAKLLNPDETITVYYPDFAKGIGKTTGIGKTDAQECLSDIRHFQTVFGIINNGADSHDILPVLHSLEYDGVKNTVCFTSPYMTRIIHEIYKESLRTDRQGNICIKKNGTPQMYPSHSYLVDMDIVKERNKKAVDIVLSIVALIEQSGKFTPHISARTIVERNPLLHSSLNTGTLRTGNKNILLERAFSKAWELLREKTSLSTVYNGIQLPDPQNPETIPTCATLDMVFTFPHHGKNANP